MPPRRRRPRGHIEQLPSGKYRARVYVGRDPLISKDSLARGGILADIGVTTAHLGLDLFAMPCPQPQLQDGGRGQHEQAPGIG